MRKRLVAPHMVLALLSGSFCFLVSLLSHGKSCLVEGQKTVCALAASFSLVASPTANRMSFRVIPRLDTSCSLVDISRPELSSLCFVLLFLSVGDAGYRDQ